MIASEFLYILIYSASAITTTNGATGRVMAKTILISLKPNWPCASTHRSIPHMAAIFTYALRAFARRVRFVVLVYIVGM